MRTASEIAIETGRAFAILSAFVISPGCRSTSVQTKFDLPENRIDVGRAALTLAKEVYPSIDVRIYSAKIDLLVEEVRRLAKGAQDPDRRIRCLNTVLLLQERFHGTRDYSLARQSDKYFLNRVLDTKQGNCFSMPVLYTAVAQRLGWPVYPVDVPDHCFVRYVDPDLKEQNIETTSNGGYVPDERYARDFRIGKAGRSSGAYLRTMTYREFLGELVAVNGIRFGRQGDLPKAISYLELATQLNPRLAGAWWNLAIVNRIAAERVGIEESTKYLTAAKQCDERLRQLGFVDPNSVPQFRPRGRAA